MLGTSRFAAIVVTAALILYTIGGFLIGGYTHDHAVEHGFIRTSWGLIGTWGSRYVLAFAGQRLTVHYDVALEAGEVDLWVSRGFSLKADNVGWSTEIRGKHVSTIDVPITATSIYSVDIMRQIFGGRYVGEYRIWWRVH